MSGLYANKHKHPSQQFCFNVLLCPSSDFSPADASQKGSSGRQPGAATQLLTLCAATLLT